MSIISIIYFSGSGNTRIFSESIQKGMRSIHGIDLINLIAINSKDIVHGRYKNDAVMKQLDDSDAIVFGSPTYMAGVAGQFKSFADATVVSWYSQKWKNKVAAGFTVSGTPSGDKLSSLQYLNALAMQHGMIWVGTGEMPVQSNGINRLGTWLGAMAQSTQDQNNLITKEDLLSGEVFGKRIAEITLQFKV